MREAFTRGVALAWLAAALGCAAGGPRTIDDPERGCRYVAPARWAVFDGELRSPGSSLFTIRVFDLREADSGFRDGLPDSILPQLEEWARSYYVVDGTPVRGETSVGGQPALELTYSVRVRAEDPVMKMLYWVVRSADRLFVLRAVFPPRALETDEPAVRELVASWQFLDVTASSRLTHSPLRGRARALRP